MCFNKQVQFVGLFLSILQVHILPKHPHNCQNTHTLQNPYIHTPTHYKAHTYTHPHITKPIHTHTHTIVKTPTHYKTHTYTHSHIHTPTHYKTHTYTHPHITKSRRPHTHILQSKLRQPQYKTHTK